MKPPSENSPGSGWFFGMKIIIKCVASADVYTIVDEVDDAGAD